MPTQTRLPDSVAGRGVSGAQSGKDGPDPSLPPEEPVVVVKMSFHTPSTMGDVAIFFVGDTSASLIVFTCV
jgi:hypothetical protein